VSQPVAANRTFAGACETSERPGGRGSPCGLPTPVPREHPGLPRPRHRAGSQAGERPRHGSGRAGRPPGPPVKLLFDDNLPAPTRPGSRRFYPDSAHVCTVGLGRAGDVRIRDRATEWAPRGGENHLARTVVDKIASLSPAPSTRAPFAGAKRWSRSHRPSEAAGRRLRLALTARGAPAGRREATPGEARSQALAPAGIRGGGPRGRTRNPHRPLLRRIAARCGERPRRHDTTATWRTHIRAPAADTDRPKWLFRDERTGLNASCASEANLEDPDRGRECMVTMISNRMQP
jgi:hypothetical protein